MSETIDDVDLESSEPDPTGPDEFVAKKKHSLALRWMHWVNFPVLMVMMYSGMRIYWSDLQEPYTIGIGSWEIFTFWPDTVNSGLQLSASLAKGIAFHLNFGWLFVINGAIYMLWLSRKGQWRHIVPDAQGLKDAGKTVAHDLHLTKQKPVQGKYNAAQQITYSAVILIAILLVASGFAIYKPGQLALLEAAFGGYDYARLVHFSATILLFGFFFIHILQVVRAGWSNFASMVTGYLYERRGHAEVEPAAAFGADLIGTGDIGAGSTGAGSTDIDATDGGATDGAVAATNEGVDS